MYVFIIAYKLILTSYLSPSTVGGSTTKDRPNFLQNDHATKILYTQLHCHSFYNNEILNVTPIEMIP